MESKIITNCPLCNSTRQKHIYNDWQSNSFVRCIDCGLVFQNPRKIITYEENYWDTAVDPDGNIRVLKNERKDKLKNFYGNTLNFVKKLNGGTILDAGCGYGFFLSALNEKWKKYGVEYSRYAVDFIRKNYPGINVIQDSLENDIFESDHFDLILCYHVIEHIRNTKNIIKLFKKYLKSNGILIIATPNVESFCARRFKGNYRLLGTPHIVLFSPKVLNKLLEENGFKVFKEEYPYFKTDYFTLKNIFRLINNNKISPPFYGNFMTFYARKTD